MAIDVSPAGDMVPPFMSDGYPERFLDLLTRRGERALLLDGVIYRRYSNMVVPFGRADVPYRLSDRGSSTALRELNGVLVRTTGGFAPPAGGAAWYAVICRRFQDVDEISSSNTRSKLRRGLRNCAVRRITAEELARRGYEVYVSAHDRYRGVEPYASEELFRSQTLATEGFEDIVHHWGVFCDDELAAYSSNYIFGNTEAFYATLKFHPKYLKKYTSYALFHEMNREYLSELGFTYVNDGFRSILHESDLQDFLEHNFNFEKAYTPLAVRYREPIGAVVRATFPFRRQVARLDRRLEALYEMEAIVRASRQNADRA